MKRYSRFLLVIALLGQIVLTACSVTQQTAEQPGNSIPMVEDIFTNPTVSTVQEDTAPVQPPQKPGASHNTMGGINIGPEGQPLMDEIGPYRLYEGGELSMPFAIHATGSIGDQGIGILLFLDGMPQPYKIEENGAYQYMHTFYPTSGEAYLADISFIPVTGQSGDTLELYAATILDPDFCIEEGIKGFVYTHGSVVSGTRLRFDAAPPSCDDLISNHRLISQTSSYIDSSFSEISGWSDTDLMEKIEAHLYVNDVDDEKDCILYGVTADEPVRIRYEVWGSPYVHYSLIVFLDNVPVFTAEEEILSVTIQNGKKTVIEAELDMTGFDGESVVYVMLVPRNYRTSEIRTLAFLNSSRTFFLVSDEKQ